MDGDGDDAYDAKVATFRDEEYPMLGGSIYLDHAGTTLYSKSLMEQFSQNMTQNLYGNPHSASASSQLSTARIEDVRLRALEFFNADPADFELVFVANATAGIKLVTEALRSLPGGFRYAYHEASHTSLVGVREEAHQSICLGDSDVAAWIDGKSPFGDAAPEENTVLFAYPGQSNMDGRRYPLSWANVIRDGCQHRPCDKVYTLLDAAALAATSPLDLSDGEVAPDFVVVSFNKIFGFPDLGALLVRREAWSAFDHRKYFGGGTVATVVCKREQWHAPKSESLHDRLEDGTLPVHSIIALDAALETQQRLFGSMQQVSQHTAYLARQLYSGLSSLKHANGGTVCVLYSQDPARQSPKGLSPGPTIPFNVRNHEGAWISLAEFEKLASLKNIHVRTGGVCNPGGIAAALGLKPWEIRDNFSAGYRCGTTNDIIAGKPTGVIRASLGAMSTMADVDSFVTFVQDFYVERFVSSRPISERSAIGGRRHQRLLVHSLRVYPIKSCGGMDIPPDVDWEVKPEGLAWDREWCLVHRGSGQALSQKRYPRMALLRPCLDFDAGVLRVMFQDPAASLGVPAAVAIPLSKNPAIFRDATSRRTLSSRVCGEEITAQAYVSEHINAFFSGVLGVSCLLARFPAGGQGKSMRHAKAHLQRHQIRPPPSLDWRASAATSTQPCNQGCPPSPPESDSEHSRRRILLSNESPILAVNLASLDALNAEIRKQGGKEAAVDVFRANVVLRSGPGDVVADSSDGVGAYAEDAWTLLRIGQHEFAMLGSCRRCHMVCVDQQTGEKNEEPFVTLARTRRFDGKVFFGAHMGHVQAPGVDGRAVQFPTVRVGDEAHAEF
jgi:molybdenum cofactor sulfurtransferase